MLLTPKVFTKRSAVTLPIVGKVMSARFTVPVNEPSKRLRCSVHKGL